MKPDRNLLALVVDDDRSLGELVAEVLARRGFRTRVATGAVEAIEAGRREHPDVIVSDIRMEPVSGMEVLRVLHQELPEAIIVMMTAFGTLETAIEAVRQGAYDYVSKPFKPEELILVLDRALESRRIAQENRRLRAELGDDRGLTEMLGRSPRMIEVFKAIARAADSTAAVLVQGETGTGKELVARAVHAHGPRRDRPFLAVNCSAIPENLLESELFGHEKGSFTGAVATHKGIFREAAGGTVFLDEIGDMPLVLQTKILRVLQSGEVRPVGASEPVNTDVRVIAATNRNLRLAVQDGSFREDLFFRLNTLLIRVPPLRERPEDIQLLVERFLRVAGEKTGRRVSGVSREAMVILSAYEWPGNVRELQNVVERAVAFSRQDVIVPDDLPRDLVEPRQSQLMSLEELERRHILYVLRATHGNRGRTAEILGIDRKTLYRKLLRFGMTGEDGSDGGDAG